VIGANDRPASSIAFSQSDRLRRRTSFSPVAGASDMGNTSQYHYKGQVEAADMDDMKSQYAGTQSGVTVFPGIATRHLVFSAMLQLIKRLLRFFMSEPPSIPSLFPKSFIFV
jgi:hypothetical protein